MDGEGCVRGCGCIMLFVAVAALVGGVQQLYTYVSNPDPVEMTCAEYAETRPEGEWVKLSECEYWLSEAVVMGMPASLTDDAEVDEFATVDDAYVPIRPKGQPVGEATPLVAHVTEGPILERISRIEAAENPQQLLDENPDWHKGIPAMVR